MYLWIDIIKSPNYQIRFSFSFGFSSIISVTASTFGYTHMSAISKHLPTKSSEIITCQNALKGTSVLMRYQRGKWNPHNPQTTVFKRYKLHTYYFTLVWKYPVYVSHLTGLLIVSWGSRSTEVGMDPSCDRSCIWGMLHTKSHLISPGFPLFIIALKCITVA